MSYYRSVHKISQSVFLLKHEHDSKQDKRIEIFKENDNISFEGLSHDLQFDMERTFKLQDRQKFPETCLYLLLQTK